MTRRMSLNDVGRYAARGLDKNQRSAVLGLTVLQLFELQFPKKQIQFLNDSFKTLGWKSNKFSLTNFLRNAFRGKLIARLPKVLKITANGIGAI